MDEIIGNMAIEMSDDPVKQVNAYLSLAREIGRHADVEPLQAAQIMAITACALMRNVVIAQNHDHEDRARSVWDSLAEHAWDASELLERSLVTDPEDRLQ
jgi:hypothetical protein